MKLGFFTMPIHPLDRNYTQTLKEDRYTIILCDKLGFYDAFVGEHLAGETIGEKTRCPPRRVRAVQDQRLVRRKIADYRPGVRKMRQFKGPPKRLGFRQGCLAVRVPLGQRRRAHKPSACRCKRNRFRSVR